MTTRVPCPHEPTPIPAARCDCRVFAGPVTQPRARAPAPTPRRVGVLAPSTQAKEEITLKPFFDQTREHWWST